jgi:hypothetical protein
MGILNNLRGKKEEQNFFFTPDNRKWGVDIDRFTKICLTSDNEKSKDTEITEGFEKDENGSFTQTSRIIREVSSQGNMQNDTIRYDLFKTLLSIILDKKVMNFGSLENEVQYDFSFNVAFNTLVKEGIIYEIK